MFHYRFIKQWFSIPLKQKSSIRVMQDGNIKPERRFSCQVFNVVLHNRQLKISLQKSSRKYRRSHFFFGSSRFWQPRSGRSGGDAVTMSWLGETTAAAKGTGYLVGTAIFGLIFVVAVFAQIKAKKFDSFLYWLTIVATTTVGTTLADYSTRSLGIGYTGGSTILLICVIASLLIWRWATGSISIETVSTPKVEMFYWITIMFSQTLGTALGDWVADTQEMGYVAERPRSSVHYSC